MESQKLSDLLAGTKKSNQPEQEEIHSIVDKVKEHPVSPEDKIKLVMDEKAQGHQCQPLPPAGRIKKAGPRLFFKTLLFFLFVALVVLIRRMDQLSFIPISEEEAMEMAQEVKVSIPDQAIITLDTKEKQTLKTGKTVKVLGVYKQKLNKGNSPRVYWTNQHYLIELPDGTRGYGPLMETAIGQRTVLPEGDTVVITAVKKAKNKPTVQSTGKTSFYDYVYTLEGYKDPYALEDLHIYFPQRVAYLGGGLTEDKYIVNNDTLSENKKDFMKVKKFFLYNIRPITKKNGFFLFPRYQEWNEFLLQRWFRMLLIFFAYVIEIVLIFKFLINLFTFKDKVAGCIRFNKNYRKAQRGDIDACYEVGEACYIGDEEYGLRDSDIGQAIRWYLKAAEKGHGGACAQLGKIYEDGIGVKKDTVEAFRWFRRGGNNSECEEGADRIANNLIAYMSYEEGLTAEKEGRNEEAFELFKASAEHGFANAQYSLGKCYYNGSGTAKNPKLAAQWFQKAAEQGDSYSQVLLGIMYIQGDGVKQDQDEGISWLIKAAKQGEKQAQNILQSLNISY